MKPYGIDRVGPVCAWGCCFAQFSRRTPPVPGWRYGSPKPVRRAKKHARFQARRQVRREMEQECGAQQERGLS